MFKPVDQVYVRANRCEVWSAEILMRLFKDFNDSETITEEGKWMHCHATLLLRSLSEILGLSTTSYL